jgi:glyoxylase I family protein
MTGRYRRAGGRASGPVKLPVAGTGPGGSVGLMLTGIHHITLNVSDLARSRAFYEGVLGLTVDQDFPGEKLRLRLGGARLVLVPPLPGTPAGDRFSEHRIGLDHLAFGVAGRAELEALAQRLRDAGVPADLHDDRAGTVALVSFRDPDNIQLEFFEQA